MAVMALSRESVTSLSGIGEVAAWMLSPDDPDLRARLTHHYAVLEQQARFRRGEISRRRAEVDDLISLALNAPSIEALRPELQQRTERGYASGMILYNAQFRILRGEREPVGRSVAEVGKALLGRQNTASKHVNEVVQKRYRPVAALWATFIAADGSEGIESLTLEEFPCRPAKLPVFLAIAEQMRQQAENTIPPRRSKPLIGFGEAITLPAEVLSILPSGRLLTVQGEIGKDSSG